MTLFSEDMKNFSDEVFANKCERTATVTDLRDQTERVLAGCRAFLRQLAEDQQAMAARCRADRTAHRRMRFEEMRAFRDRVRREHQQASQRMREMLAQNRGTRQKDVHTLLQGFRTAMQQLATDFRTAHRFWCEMEGRQPGSQPHGSS